MLDFWIVYAKISKCFQHRKKVYVYRNILSCSPEADMHHGEVAVLKDSVRTSVLIIGVCVYIYIYI